MDPGIEGARRERVHYSAGGGQCKGRDSARGGRDMWLYIVVHSGHLQTTTMINHATIVLLLDLCRNTQMSVGVGGLRKSLGFLPLIPGHVHMLRCKIRVMYVYISRSLFILFLIFYCLCMLIQKKNL